jgi:hypothetical protein
MVTDTHGRHPLVTDAAPAGWPQRATPAPAA